MEERPNRALKTRRRRPPDAASVPRRVNTPENGRNQAALQDLVSITPATTGVVVRLHDAGRVPADNPFVGRGGAFPEIWSYGHRNSQGLAVHPESGAIWLTEHGPQGWPSIVRLEPVRWRPQTAISII